MSSESGRKLSDLRVCDLKEELEIRKLDVTGVKNVLVERMQKALEDDGKDPNTFLFSPLEKKLSPKTSLKKTDVDEGASSADKIVDTSGERKTVGDVGAKEAEVIVDEVGVVDKEAFNNNQNNQPTDINMNDNDEINLTIEEDEQKLLHDEAQDEKDKTLTDDNQSISSEIKTNEKLPEDNLVQKDVDNKCESEKEEKTKAEKKDKENEKTVLENTKDESDHKNSKGSISKEDKEKSTGEKLLSSPSSSRNLWVSGLSSLTRASDLKTIFSKFGKVIGAKVVTNTRTPGTRCYGYVTMLSSTDASRCIEHLHCTELHGRIISVERTKNELGINATLATSAPSSSNTTSKKKEDEKKKSPSKGSIRVKSNDELRDSKDNPKDKTTITSSGISNSITSTASKEKEKASLSGDVSATDSQADKTKTDPASRKSSGGVNNSQRSRSPRGTVRRRGGAGNRQPRPRRPSFEREKARTAREREILSYQKIREERERQRLRERERALREEDRRRVEIRRRQREEEQRLAREREKLALERERLEREKAEILRMERERQKLERERIELERLELKRQQMKIMQQSSRTDETKRPVKRSSNDRYSSDRKRTAPTERRFEAPPPPRFDTTLSTSYDRDNKKRDDYASSSSKRDDYSSSKRDDYQPIKRDEYSSSSKLVEYPTVKREEFSSNKRDDYKREVEVTRHSSSSGNYHGTGRDVSATHKTSNRYSEPQGFRRNEESNFPKKKPMSEVKVHRPIEFKNTMISTVPDASGYRNSTGSKRYDGVSGGGSNYNSDRTSSTNPNWQSGTHISGGHSSHSGHSNHSGSTTLKSYINNGMSSSVNVPNWQAKSTDDHWRQVDTTQDRYDRTYNERSGPYIENATRTGMYVANARPGPDRYCGQVQRYENGKY